MLSAEQQREFLQVIRLGCDVAAACDYVDCGEWEAVQQMTRDDEFRREFRRADASAQMRFMRLIHEASLEPKNWRVAKWWFERRDARTLSNESSELQRVALSAETSSGPRLLGEATACDRD